MRFHLWRPLIPLTVLALVALALAAGVFAENVDPNNDNSQFAYGENVGWLNAEPANCGDCGVQVSNTKLTGFMYGENIGWINMSCENNTPCTGPAGNWGVSNDGAGNLSGYAYGENVGWISLSCQNTPSTCASTGDYGVSISGSTGVFSGNAYGENIGWITFSATSPVAYQVQAADTDSDTVFDGSDNCPGDPNAGQENTDADNATAGFRFGLGVTPPILPGDLRGDICDTDDDNDGFSDADEQTIFGVSPGSDEELTPCRTLTVTNPWPPDTFPTVTPDRLVDGQDLVAFLPALFKGFGASGYIVRLDIFDPGVTIDGQDLVAMLPNLFKSCQSP